MFGILVPEMKSSVTSGGTESTVDRMERNSVDAVYFRDVAVVRVWLAVTFEAEVGTVSWVRASRNGMIENGVHANVRLVLLLHILNRTASFYAADRKASGVSEARHHTCLPLQAALYRLVKFHRVVQVDDVAIAVCSANDEQRVFDVHGVNALLTLDSPHRCRLPQIPVLDCFVP